MIAFLTGRTHRVAARTFTLSLLATGCCIAMPAMAQVATNVRVIDPSDGSDDTGAVCVYGTQIIVVGGDDCSSADNTVVQKFTFGSGATQTTLWNDGQATFNNRVSFNAQVDLNGATNISGTLSLGGSLSTNGITNTGSIGTGSLTTTGNATIGGALNVTGNMSVRDLGADGLLVTGDSFLDGSTIIVGALKAA